MTRNSAIAQAVTTAQQLASAEGRAYVVARGTPDAGPLVEPLAGLEILGSFLAAFIDAGRVLLVTPLGMYQGLTVAEIVAESQAAR